MLKSAAHHIALRREALFDRLFHRTERARESDVNICYSLIRNLSHCFSLPPQSLHDLSAGRGTAVPIYAATNVRVAP